MHIWKLHVSRLEVFVSFQPFLSLSFPRLCLVRKCSSHRNYGTPNTTLRMWKKLAEPAWPTSACLTWTSTSCTGQWPFSKQLCTVNQFHAHLCESPFNVLCVCLCVCGFRRGKELMPRREDGSICYSDTHYRDTWAAMEGLVDKGLVRAIGLSNFNARQTADIITIAKHKPVVNQV